MAIARPHISDERKSRRHHRVVELVRREIVQILSREVKDPRLGNFTVTEVDLSPDIRTALIYVCRFITGDIPREPTRDEKDELVSGLSSASHFVYERLKKRLVMKQIPSIRFLYDERLAKASSMWSLVHRVQLEDAERNYEAEGVRT